MNVADFKYCPYCGNPLKSNKCEKCSRTMYSSPHPNVGLLICDVAKRQFLLVKEKKTDSISEPQWEIPGGFVNVTCLSVSCGESLEAALEREIEEELGDHNARTLKSHLRYFKSSGDTYELITMRWFDVNDLPDLEYRCDREAIADFI